MECEIWLLIILTPVFSTVQLPHTGTNSSRIAPDCVEKTLYYKYVLFTSSICERVMYKWYLSAYLPTDCDMQYYSKWLYFALPHATTPTYIRIAR